MTMSPEDSDRLAKAVKALDALNLSTECHICLERMKSPVRIPCGHSFCQMCIEHHLILDLNEPTTSPGPSPSPGKRTVRTCPLRCKQKLTKRCIRPDKNLEMMIAHILELEKSFELDVGGLIDLSQVRNRKLDGGGLEAPREAPEPAKSLKAATMGKRKSIPRTGLPNVKASTSRGPSNLEAGTSKIEQPVNQEAGDLLGKGETKAKKTPKRKSKTEQIEETKKAKPEQKNLLKSSKVSEYIFSDDDDDDDATADNDFDPPTPDSEPSFPQASPVSTDKMDVGPSPTSKAIPIVIPIRSDPVTTSTPTLSRRRSLAKTKQDVSTEKTVQATTLSPSRASVIGVTQQRNMDPSPGKVPVSSLSRSVKAPVLNPIPSVVPSPANPEKPRFQFLWRGMKKADAVLQPETKPRKKILFLKLGQLASGQEKFDTDPTSSDIEVESSVTDINVHEGGDAAIDDRHLDEVVADEELERGQSQVSPSQEIASRSILTQLPVGNQDMLDLDTGKGHVAQAKTEPAANISLSNNGKRSLFGEDNFAKENLIENEDDSTRSTRKDASGVKTSKRMTCDDSSDDIERPSKRHTRRISSRDESDAEGEASMLQSTQEMEKELERLKEQKLKETVSNKPDSENIIDNISDDDDDIDMLTNTPQTNRRSLNLSYVSRKKGIVVETSAPAVPASPLKEQNLNSSFHNSQESNWGEEDEDVASFCVISTGLSKRKREDFTKFLNMFKILTSKSLNDDVTHVVIEVTSENCAVRTLKYIQAVSMGKTIASYSWILECIEAGRILPTIRFEPKDSGGEPGPQRSRIYFMNNLGQKFFQNYSFCLLGMFVNEVPRADIENILIRLGGQVVKNVADLSVSRRGGRQRLVIVENSKTPNPEVKRIFPTCRVVVLSKEWVLDSVGAFQLKNIFPYVQGAVKKEDLIEAGYII